MTKKILFGMMAAIMLFATSCEKEPELGGNAGQKSVVSFNIGTPEIATRAYSDGATATVLQYAVYDAAGNELEDLTVTDGEIHGSTTVNLQLTTGNTYSVIFWAAAPTAPYSVDFANKTMTVDYTNAVSNDEKRDAFYKYHTFTVKGAQTETIELKRPFAQLNIGTNDYAASTSAGYTPTQSAVTVKNIYSSLNFATGAVDGDVEANFALANIKKDEVFPVADYEYLAMNYLLVGADKETVDVEFTYTDGSNAKTRTVGSVPVQRNYRTNIYGQLLTSNVKVNVEIEPDYDGSHVADDLMLAAAVGGEVTLTEDVELDKPLNVQANMVINLNGKTISAEFAKGDGAVVEIAEGVSAKLIGGTIENLTVNGDAAINNAGNLVLSNITINGAPIGATDYPAYAVISSGNMTIEEGTVISADRGSIKVTGAGETVINGGTFTNNDIGSRSLTSHVVDVENGGTHKLTINGGTFQHLHTATSGGVVICNRTKGTVYVNGGNFSGGNYYGNNNLSDYGYGGTFSVKGGVYSAKPADKYIAEGYQVVKKADKWHVLTNDITVASTPEAIKDVFANGGSIVLAEDINFKGITSIEPGKEVKLDLNGKTITVEENTQSNTLIYVKEGAKLIIDGDGVIDLGKVSTMAIFAPYGELVIENGTFIRDEVTTVTNKTTGLFMGCKVGSSNVTINGGYFDPGYYNTDAADIDEILAGTKTLVETADDIAKRGNSKDANKVRVAVKDNISVVLNHSGYGSFKIYGGTFVGANPAWGDEGCMLPTKPNYLRPWSYYQGALLDGQTFKENGIVLPDGYTITKGATTSGIPTYTVSYSK